MTAWYLNVISLLANFGFGKGFFWPLKISILGKEVYEAIINHELVHLEQNHVNLEQHILRTLCKLKNKQQGSSFLFDSNG